MAFRQTHSEAGNANSPGANEAASATANGAGVRAADDPDGTGAAAAQPRAVSLADEQAYVTMLYDLLDVARARSQDAIRDVHARGEAGGTHQARLERDITATEQHTRLAQLNGIERGLCFGRTDDSGDLTL